MKTVEREGKEGEIVLRVREGMKGDTVDERSRERPRSLSSLRWRCAAMLWRCPQHASNLPIPSPHPLAHRQHLVLFRSPSTANSSNPLVFCLLLLLLSLRSFPLSFNASQAFRDCQNRIRIKQIQANEKPTLQDSQMPSFSVEMHPISALLLFSSTQE